MPPSFLSGAPVGKSIRLAGRRHRMFASSCVRLGFANRTYHPPSNIYLRAELDHSVGRDLELIRGAQGIALQQHKQLAAQIKIPGALLHDEGLVGHKERGLHHPAAQPLGVAAVEDLLHVRGLTPAIARHHPPEGGGELLDADPAHVMDVGHVLYPQGEKDDPLVQHLVVLEVVQERMGDHIDHSRHIDGGARHPGRGGFLQRGDHRLQRVAVLVQAANELEALALPAGHQGEHHGAQGQRQPAAGDNLGQIRGKERHIDAEQQDQQGGHQILVPVPAVLRHRAEENGGQHHGAGHRDAIGGRQIAGVLEAHDDDHHGHIEHPVDDRNIDLARLLLRGVHDANGGEITESHRLTGEGEDPGDDCLGGDDGGQGRQQQERQQRPLGSEQEEGVGDGLGVAEQQGPLAEVVEYQGGQHHHKPGAPDRALAKVAHVRIERLHPGDGQYHGAEGKEGGEPVFHKEAQGPERVERPQYLGVVEDAAKTKRRQGQKPDQHDGGKQLADGGGAVLLNGKQQGQHQHRERHYVGVEGGGHDVQPLDGRHHRHGGGDHHLAIEEAAANQPQDDQHRRPLLGAVAGRQRHQGQYAPLASVVGPHHEGEVLDRDHQDQQPEDQREEAQDGGGLDAKAKLAGEALAQGIERTGADIAIDHADRRQGDAGEGGFVITVHEVVCQCLTWRGCQQGARQDPYHRVIGSLGGRVSRIALGRDANWIEGIGSSWTQSVHLRFSS